MTDLRRERQDRDDRTAKRAHRLSAQFYFLLALIIFVGVVLAYRTEVNDERLRTGLLTACHQRVNAAEEFNKGREALIAYVTSTPAPNQTEDQRAELVAKLRSGLLLPLESCGD